MKVYMDVSLNTIDLQYLTNPLEMVKLGKKNVAAPYNLTKDITFYRRRIFQQTKEYLRGKQVVPKLDRAFENYARVCVEHFKFIDKSDIIQRDYEQLKPDKPKITANFDINDSNEVMMKKKAPQNPKITDHIKLKSNRVKVKRKIILPKNRVFDLKNSKFRTKGTIDR